jgi:hypothetical protein
MFLPESLIIVSTRETHSSTALKKNGTWTLLTSGWVTSASKVLK